MLLRVNSASLSFAGSKCKFLKWQLVAARSKASRSKSGCDWQAVSNRRAKRKIRFKRLSPPQATSSRPACARASSVTSAPDSMRAISSRRSAASSRRTPVRVTVPSWLLAISSWRSARAATCGLWVTTSSCALRRQSRQPVADRRRHRAADAAVDLVEDHRARARPPRPAHLEREDEARQLAAATRS